MHILDTWGDIQEVENTVPDLKAEMEEKRPTQITEKSNNIMFPLFHPGQDDRNSGQIPWILLASTFHKKEEQAREQRNKNRIRGDIR